MFEDIVLSKEFQQLNKNYEELSEYYISLIEEKETLIGQKKVYLESQYLSYFGYLLEKRFNYNIEIRRLRKKISMIRSALNKREKVDMEKIDEQLYEEMLVFYEELKKFKMDIEESKEYLESPVVSEEELREIKQIFRQLVKKIHPDMKKDFNEKDQIIFQRVLNAYECNNLEALRALKTVILNDTEIEEEKDSIDELKTKIKNINENIIKIIDYMNKVKEEFPFDIQDELQDTDWVEAVRRGLTQEVKELNKQKEVCREILEGLKGELCYE